MTAGLSCEVYVDSNRLADTRADYLASAPTALAGLSVTWGRSNVIDQPDVSSCAFTVADIGGDADFLSLLHVGHTLDVYAAGTVSGGQPADIAVDGSLESTPLTRRAYSASAALAYETTHAAADGVRSLRVAPLAAPSGSAALPPAPFSPSLTAWDELPSVTPGEQWSVTVYVIPPAGSRFATGGTVQAAIFTTPTAGPPAVVGPTVAIPAWTADSWAPVTATLTVPAGYTVGWVGAVVTFPAPGAAWQAWPGTWAAQTLTWRQISTGLADFLHVIAPASAVRRALVFTGRITDLTASPAATGVEVKVTASDWVADLANDYVGDQPWTVETLAARFARIAGLSTSHVAFTVDAWPGALPVSWRDVDSASVADLLGELAATADGVLWAAFSGTRGFYLWLEDVLTRQAMATLTLDGGSGLVVITGSTRGAAGVLSACDVTRDPVQWQQDVTDVLSRIDLTWQEQTLDDKGQPAPTERHIVLTDDAALTEFGVRRLGYSTQLVAAADGQAVAQRVLNRSRALGWHVSGINWDTQIPDPFAQSDRDLALDLLDGTRRIGLPLALTNLPDWTPGGGTLGTYLEGGTYEFDGGRWKFQLTLSPAGLTGASVPWNGITAAWQWRQFSPSIRWLDMNGVQGGTT